jgi:hypothetical protein
MSAGRTIGAVCGSGEDGLLAELGEETGALAVPMKGTEPHSLPPDFAAAWSEMLARHPEGV